MRRERREWNSGRKGEGYGEEGRGTDGVEKGEGEARGLEKRGDEGKI